MSKQQEALRLALEALESCDAAHITDGGRQWYDEKLVDKAITAIKEALANEALEKMAENARELGLDYEPPQEPVAWINKMSIDVPNKILYTAPKRTWVGLTDEDLEAEFGFIDELLRDTCYRTEAKLKAKNVL